jgi:hypothetical protein
MTLLHFDRVPEDGNEKTLQFLSFPSSGDSVKMEQGHHALSPLFHQEKEKES